ncbi:MAG: site-specific integrase, partial [Chloroflexota bacterium]|nr:site-specific integrase [Chloroflexota bacterium]
DDITKQGKERTLAADESFAALYDRYLAYLASRPSSEVSERLFPVGPPAVNGMVERVRVAAGIGKEVTPQTLRHTFAVGQARAGANEAQLLKILGLADDPRNRASVGRYLKLAEPPLETDSTPR